MTLGDFVRAYRAEHKMNIRDFANQSGLSPAYISILERNINPASGKPPVPSLETIQAVARVICIDFNDIISALDRDQEIALESSDAVPLPTPSPKRRKNVAKPKKNGSSPILRAITTSLNQLNEDGQKKVSDYVNDLVSSGRYKKVPCSKGEPAEAV